MHIKKLFKTEEEYLDYAWLFMSFDENKIWKEEDLPKLQLFFDVREYDIPASDNMSEKDLTAFRESMAHYHKCSEEYANELFEIRDAIRQFSINKLAEFFLLEKIEMDCYDSDENGNDLDEEGNIIPPISRETIKIADDWKEKVIFPLIFVGYIHSGFDRFGKSAVAMSDFVSLKDFEEK